jgi:hypothetical protein
MVNRNKIPVITGYKYNGMTRNGLINGNIYKSEQIREPGWFNWKEIMIGGKWYKWASFTEILTTDDEMFIENRDNKIVELLK